MKKHKDIGSEPHLDSLAKGILDDAQNLLTEHLELFRSEVKEELGKARIAALSLGTGAGLVALGGVLSALTVAHLLHRSTRLPLWSCYGIVSGLLGATGVGLLYNASRTIATVQLAPPPETARALQEDANWLRRDTANAGR
jgi:hypothetical protein